MTIDRVNLAVISIRRIQENCNCKPMNFWKLFNLIIQAYKGIGSNECTLCEIGGRSNRDRLERHHIAGREHLPDALTVCLPCHNALSEKQKKWQYNKNEPHIALSSYFHGLSDIFELLFEQTKQDQLKALAAEFRNKAWYIRNCTPPK